MVTFCTSHLFRMLLWSVRLSQLVQYLQALQSCSSEPPSPQSLKRSHCSWTGMQRWLLQVNSVFPQGRGLPATTSASVHIVSVEKTTRTHNLTHAVPHIRVQICCFRFQKILIIEEEHFEMCTNYHIPYTFPFLNVSTVITDLTVCQNVAVFKIKDAHYHRDSCFLITLSTR